MLLDDGKRAGLVTKHKEVNKCKEKVDQERESHVEYEVLCAQRHAHEVGHECGHEEHDRHCQSDGYTDADEDYARHIRLSVVFEDKVLHQDSRQLEGSDYEAHDRTLEQHRYERRYE